MQKIPDMNQTANSVRTIIDNNIGAISGSYVLVYDSQSALSRVLTAIYTQVLEEKKSSNAEVQLLDFDALNAEDLKSTLIHLTRGSLVILVQSTNFRLTDFRVRLELFQHGIHCIEHNHLGYIKDDQIPTYLRALTPNTKSYVEQTELLNQLNETSTNTTIYSSAGAKLHFGKLEIFRGNTGDYTAAETKGGTYPIGEAFSEAVDLTSVHGNVRVFAYPDAQFQVVFCEPFTIVIENGRVVHDPTHPSGFLWLMDKIRLEEDEVLVRELGVGFNPYISQTSTLSDVNSFERQLGVHLSLGKKHGIFGKKLPKDQLQRYHIDIFIEVEKLQFGDTTLVFKEQRLVCA